MTRKIIKPQDLLSGIPFIDKRDTWCKQDEKTLAKKYFATMKEDDSDKSPEKTPESKLQSFNFNNFHQNNYLIEIRNKDTAPIDQIQLTNKDVSNLTLFSPTMSAKPIQLKNIPKSINFLAGEPSKAEKIS